jgi:hypothetical protein
MVASVGSSDSGRNGSKLEHTISVTTATSAATPKKPLINAVTLLGMNGTYSGIKSKFIIAVTVCDFKWPLCSR